MYLRSGDVGGWPVGEFSVRNCARICAELRPNLRRIAPNCAAAYATARSSSGLEPSSRAEEDRRRVRAVERRADRVERRVAQRRDLEKVREARRGDDERAVGEQRRGGGALRRAVGRRHPRRDAAHGGGRVRREREDARPAHEIAPRRRDRPAGRGRATRAPPRARARRPCRRRRARASRPRGRRRRAAARRGARRRVVGVRARRQLVPTDFAHVEPEAHAAPLRARTLRRLRRRRRRPPRRRRRCSSSSSSSSDRLHRRRVGY